MYYRLILSGGHVGAGNELDMVRYFRSENPVELFSMAARAPRVKGKSSGTGVKLVQPVSREEYERGVKAAKKDPYLSRRRVRLDYDRKDLPGWRRVF